MNWIELNSKNLLKPLTIINRLCNYNHFIQMPSDSVFNSLFKVMYHVWYYYRKLFCWRTKCVQVVHCSLEYTFRTIFWVLFGLKDARMVELSDSLVKPCSAPGQQFNGRFTESVGYIVFGVYNWGAVIVLLNMLIAMMTRSFDKIAVITCVIFLTS